MSSSSLWFSDSLLRSLIWCLHTNFTNMNLRVDSVISSHISDFVLMELPAQVLALPSWTGVYWCLLLLNGSIQSFVLYTEPSWCHQWQNVLDAFLCVVLQVLLLWKSFLTLSFQLLDPGFPSHPHLILGLPLILKCLSTCHSFPVFLNDSSLKVLRIK